MRRSSIIASLTVLAVTVILFSAMPNWLTIGATDIGDKAKGFVGTWYVPGNADMITYHEGGTLTGNGFLTWWLPPWGFHSASSGHGTWVRTGRRSLQSVAFVKLQTLDSQHWRIWRVRTTAIFDEGFEQIIGGLVVLDEYECFAPFVCPNPLTEPPTNLVFEGPAGPAFRVRVE